MCGTPLAAYSSSYSTTRLISSPSDRISAFEAGAAVDPEALRQKGLVKKKGPVKVLGQGDVSKALKVRANAFSSSAVAKLEAAGGSAEVIEPKPS